MVTILIVLALILVAVWFVGLSLPQRVSTALALTLFLVSIVGGSWIAYDSSLSHPVLLYLVSNIALGLIVAYSPLSPRRLAIIVVILNSLLAFYFVGQYAAFEYEAAVVGVWGQMGRATGSFLPAFVLFRPQPNSIASFLEGVFLLNLALLKVDRRRRRWVWAGTALLMAYALLISGSRGAWLGLALAGGGGLLLYLPGRIRLPVATGLVLTAGAFFFIFVAFQPALADQSVVLLNPEVHTTSGRLALYRNAFYLGGDYPITGIGLDAFANVYSRDQLITEAPFLRQPHNLFLSVWLGQGLLGLIAVGWLLLEFYRFVIRVERTTPPGRTRRLFRGAWLGTTAIFVHSLTDDAWLLPMQFVLAGLTMAAGRAALARFQDRQPSHSGLSRSPAQKKILPLAWTAIFILTVLFLRRPLLSAWYANQGALYQTQAALSPRLDDPARAETLARAVGYFEQALAIDAGQPAANRRLGMIALEQHAFATALSHLKQAYQAEPANQATLKLLGYAYLWTGRLELAEEHFRQVERRDELVGELTHYWWWWGVQDQKDLSDYAHQMRQRLLAPANLGRQGARPVPTGQIF